MRTARADGPKIWKWTMMPPALKPPTHTHHAWDHAHTHSVNVAIISLSVNITSLNATWRTHTNCHRQTDWSVSRCLITTGTEADRQAVKSDGQTVSRRRANCIYACFFLPRTGTFSCTLHTHTHSDCLVAWEISMSPFSIKIGYIGNKVMGGDLVPIQ